VGAPTCGPGRDSFLRQFNAQVVWHSRKWEDNGTQCGLISRSNSAIHLDGLTKTSRPSCPIFGTATVTELSHFVPEISKHNVARKQYFTVGGPGEQVITYGTMAPRAAREVIRHVSGLSNLADNTSLNIPRKCSSIDFARAELVSLKMEAVGSSETPVNGYYTVHPVHCISQQRLLL
jgi:hypothetical protein